MHIDFNTALVDAWGKAIRATEGSEEMFALGDAVLSALDFVARGKEPTEDEKRRRWKLQLRLTQRGPSVEEQTKYPTLKVGKEPALTPDDVSFLQKCVHDRWQSPMVYAQCWEMLCGTEDEAK